MEMMQQRKKGGRRKKVFKSAADDDDDDGNIINTTATQYTIFNENWNWVQNYKCSSFIAYCFPIYDQMWNVNCELRNYEYADTVRPMEQSEQITVDCEGNEKKWNWIIVTSDIISTHNITMGNGWLPQLHRSTMYLRYILCFSMSVWVYMFMLMVIRAFIQWENAFTNNNYSLTLNGSIRIIISAANAHINNIVIPFSSFILNHIMMGRATSDVSKKMQN